MATFYIDPVNGNDSNAGTSWGTAWRTITSGATAARIAPNDEIRVAETPAISTGVNATFTNGSAAVTLASALTKTINHADSVTGWTAAPNITLTNNTTTTKFGSSFFALNVAPATAFTTGKVCHAAVTGGGVQDFSGYTKISFWMRPVSPTTINANTYKLCLCSDANGNTIVNEINIPATINNTGWHIVVLDNVTALGSSIQSVAIYANTDPGTTNFSINNIVACNNVTHRTLIGWQNDCFYNVQSFNGTTINIDGNSPFPGGQGWYGSTGTQELHYINPNTNLSSGVFNTINEGGTSAIAPIKFTGGWNTTSNTRTGYTAFASNIVGVGTNMSATLLNYFEISNFILARSATNIVLTNSSLYTIDNCVFCGGGPFTFVGYAEIKNSKIINQSGACTLSSGLYYNCTFANIPAAAASATLSPKLIRCVFGNNQGSFPNSFTGGTNYPGSAVSLYKCLLADPIEISITSLSLNNIIWSYDHDQILGNHWGFTFGATINWQTAVKQGSDPGSWRVVHSNLQRNSAFPVRFQFAQIAVSANAQVTVKAWVKKDHATDVGCRIFVEDADFTLAGITAQSATAANNTSWQELTIQFTPTVDGIVPIWFDSWYISANSNTYIGSITVTQ